MERANLSDFAISIGALAAFAVGSAMVSVRDVVRPEVTAVALAVVVVAAGRIGGRAAALVTAIMSAMCFDFFHTEPYLSLKITDASDVIVTVLLLVVGVVAAGVFAPRVSVVGGEMSGTTRVLVSSRNATPEDVELAVRAEILGLLKLQDCWFTSDAVLLPVLDSTGEMPEGEMRYTREGFELPRDGVAIEVTAFGQRDGYLVCHPTAGAGVGFAERRMAAELGSLLALARRAA